MSEELEAVRRRRLVSMPLGTTDFQPPAALVRAEFGARTHRGGRHPENDDHYLILRLTQHQDVISTSLANVDLPHGLDEHAYAAVIADGIGREGAGSVAARLAISTLAGLAQRFAQWNMRIDPRIASDVLDRAEWLYNRAHEAVLQRSLVDMQLAGMAAAMTGIYSVGSDLFVASVGHSRCYLFRDGTFVQLTRDQTLQERLATSRYPTPLGQAIEDAQHILTSAIGAAAGLHAIVEHFRLADDDTLLLTTHGLTDVVDDDTISDTLASRRTPAEQCEMLLDLARAKDLQHDATVVLVNYQVPELPADPD